jgi:hypothetical protein
MNIYAGSHTTDLVTEIVVVVHADDVRLCLWTATTNRPIVHFTPDNLYNNGEALWNDTDRWKQKNSKKSLTQCHSVHHKSQIYDRGAKKGSRDERPTTNRLSHGTAFTDLNNAYIAERRPPKHCTRALNNWYLAKFLSLTVQAEAQNYINNCKLVLIHALWKSFELINSKIWKRIAYPSRECV